MYENEFIRIVNDLPKWELDALRRLLVNGSLNANDDELTIRLIKQEYGVKQSGPQVLAVPAATADIARLMPAAGSFFLAGVVAGDGCSALARGAHLPVDPCPGLQVYRGRNGSGKSSFARILRAAGSARVGVDILPDVFAPMAEASCACATFELYVKGELEHIDWDQKSGSDSRLTAVAVYDSDCSTVYLEGGNVAEYTPRGLDVFASLVEARKRLKALLQSEVAALKKEMPAVAEEVEYSQVSSVLRGWWYSEAPETSIERLAVWNSADERRFKELTEAIEKAKNIGNIYAKRAEEIAKARHSLEALQSIKVSITGILENFSETMGTDLEYASARLMGKRHDLEAAKAKAVSSSQFNIGVVSILPGTDTAEWFALIQAARRFSEMHAYSGISFPAVQNECLCVLCQQPLSDAAAVRLNHFAAMLESAGRGDSDENEEIRILSQELAGLETTHVSELRKFDDALALVRQVAASVTRMQIQSQITTSLRFCEAFLDTSSQQARAGRFNEIDLAGLRHVMIETTENIEIAEMSLGEMIRRLEDQLGAPPKALDDNELKELIARRWLRANKPQMLHRVELIQTINALEGAAGSLGSIPVTNVSKRIAAEIVTDRLIDAIRRELHHVGLGYLKAQVVSSGRAGVTTIRLAPPDKIFKKTDMSQVLSEGEQALMGLAAFLAELDTVGHTGPIVLDDPVSGLDADNRRVMATRLANVAIERQVLVLTHDDEFVAMLEDAALAVGAKIKTRTITRRGMEVGIVD